MTIIAKKLILFLVLIFVVCYCHASTIINNASSLPPNLTSTVDSNSNQSIDPSYRFTSSIYLEILVVIALVLMGGLVAGLTLGLMSLDSNNLQILANSGDETQRKYAKRIQPIRKNGHLLLVTLLLSNTLINESLPIFLDSIAGGGFAAIIISTVLILIFGEVIPQAICSRHGLRVGAFFAWPVKILIKFLYPVAYPMASLLDWVLGEHHGLLYRRPELKELVSIHGLQFGGSLTDDEVTIIQGALDLSEKCTGEIMTDLSHVFMLDVKTILNKQSLSQIMQRGHSRIPIYQNHRHNIIGLILVKSMILIDPNANTPVSDLKIYPVPSVPATFSLFDLLNSFQEGASHMSVVLEPKEHNAKPIGIVTLEDVIEELIQEEIIDETDEFVDVPKQIRVRRVKPPANTILQIVRNRSKSKPKIRPRTIMTQKLQQKARSIDSYRSEEPSSPLNNNYTYNIDKDKTTRLIPHIAKDAQVSIRALLAPRRRNRNKVFDSPKPIIPCNGEDDDDDDNHDNGEDESSHLLRYDSLPVVQQDNFQPSSYGALSCCSTPGCGSKHDHICGSV